MTRAQGARAQMGLAFESTYGTAPGSGYKRVPFVSATLGSEQNLLDNEVLGFGRDPLEPARDALNADGTVVIPMDVNNIGLWLKATFGAPTSVGTVAATGKFTFSAQPAANSVLTINGATFTFKASGASGDQSNIGVSLAATLTAAASALNASATAGLAAITYSATATEILMTVDALGGAGNLLALAADSNTNATPSGATFSGGASTHTFTSGSWTLPSLAIETQMPEVPKFSMFAGCVVDSLGWEMRRSGLLQATAKLIAQGETIAASTEAGSLTSYDYDRFSHFNGAIKREGAALSNTTQARFSYMNNLDRIDAIRGDGLIDGADPSIAACKGQIVTRFADRTLLDQATAGDPCELEFSHTIDAKRSLVVTVHAVYLPRPRIEIGGPGGIEATFDWQAAQTAAGGAMVTAVLTNGLGGY